MPAQNKLSMTKFKESLTDLGFDKTDRPSDTEVRKRFRKLAMENHPDKNLERPEEAAEQFKKIAAAYEYLQKHSPSTIPQQEPAKPKSQVPKPKRPAPYVHKPAPAPHRPKPAAPAFNSRPSNPSVWDHYSPFADLLGSFFAEDPFFAEMWRPVFAFNINVSPFNAHGNVAYSQMGSTNLFSLFSSSSFSSSAPVRSPPPMMSVMDQFFGPLLPGFTSIVPPAPPVHYGLSPLLSAPVPRLVLPISTPTVAPQPKPISTPPTPPHVPAAPSLGSAPTAPVPPPPPPPPTPLKKAPRTFSKLLITIPTTVLIHVLIGFPPFSAWGAGLVAIRALKGLWLAGLGAVTYKATARVRQTYFDFTTRKIGAKLDRNESISNSTITAMHNGVKAAKGWVPYFDRSLSLDNPIGFRAAHEFQIKGDTKRLAQIAALKIR